MVNEVLRFTALRVVHIADTAFKTAYICVLRVTEPHRLSAGFTNRKQKTLQMNLTEKEIRYALRGLQRGSQQRVEDAKATVDEEGKRRAGLHTSIHYENPDSIFPFVCPSCSKSFKKKQGLSIHLTK